MKPVSSIILSVMIFIMSGCGGSKRALIWTSYELDRYQAKTYAVLPFEDRNSPKYKNKYVDAAEIVRDAFETAFLETGHRTVERNKLRMVTSELELSMSGLTEEQGMEIGKMLNVDAVVFGIVTSYYRGSFFGDYTTVGFSVRAVHVESGVIIWKGSHTKKAKWNYDLDPGIYANEVAREIVQGLITKGHFR